MCCAQDPVQGVLERWRCGVAGAEVVREVSGSDQQDGDAGHLGDLPEALDGCRLSIWVTLTTRSFAVSSRSGYS